MALCYDSESDTGLCYDSDSSQIVEQVLRASLAASGFFKTNTGHVDSDLTDDIIRILQTFIFGVVPNEYGEVEMKENEFKKM